MSVETDYRISISEEEFADLRSKFSTAKFAKTRALPKVFTEKGLYMIATILKSKQATEATFAIIETFSKIRQTMTEKLIIKDLTPNTKHLPPKALRVRNYPSL